MKYPRIIHENIKSYTSNISFKTLMESIDNNKIEVLIPENYKPDKEIFLSTILFFFKDLPIKPIYTIRDDKTFKVLKGNKTILNLYLFYTGVFPTSVNENNSDKTDIHNYLKNSELEKDVKLTVFSEIENKLIEINYNSFKGIDKKC